MQAAVRPSASDGSSLAKVLGLLVFLGQLLCVQTGRPAPCGVHWVSPLAKGLQLVSWQRFLHSPCKHCSCKAGGNTAEVTWCLQSFA